MAKNPRAQSTGGANGPRSDEDKANTPDAAERDSLFDSVDDDEFDTDVGGNQNPKTTQDTRGSHGLASIHDRDRQIHSDAHDHEGFYGVHADEGLMEEFENPRNLIAPEARPGMVQCWIDWFDPAGNQKGTVLQMLKRGWKPRDPSTIPKAEASFFERRETTDGELILARGQVLCEMPRERMERIEQWEAEQAQRLRKASMNPIRNANRDGQRAGYDEPIQVSVKSSTSRGRA